MTRGGLETMSKPFKIKHGLQCAEIFEVNKQNEQVSIKGVRVATIDDLVGGGGTIGDVNDLTTTSHVIVGAINEVAAEVAINTDEITDLENGLAAEITDRIGGDASLTQSINDEVSTREANDTLIRDDIVAEASIRSATDTNLQDSINNEADTRYVADVALGARIDDADQAIIDGDASTLAAAASLVNTESGERTAVDINLQSQINGIQGDVNKFYHLDLAADHTIDLMAGNYFSVSTTQHQTLTLPPEIPNGGQKLIIDNTGNFSVSVKDNNGDILVSIPATEKIGIIFDDSNEKWGVEIKSDDEENIFNPLDAVNVPKSFNSSSTTNAIKRIAGNLINLIFDDDASTWKLSIFSDDLGGITTFDVSNTLSGSTKITLSILNDEKFLLAYNTTVEIFSFNGSTIERKVITDLSTELNSLTINDALGLDEFTFVATTYTISKRNIHFFDISPTFDITEDFTKFKTFSGTMNEPFSKLSKFAFDKIGFLFSTTNIYTKSFRTIDYTEDVISAQINFNTMCENIAVIDKNHFVVTDNTDNIKVLSNFGSMFVNEFIYTDFNATASGNNFDINNTRHGLSIIDDDDEYYKTFIIAQKTQNNYSYMFFTLNVEDYEIKFKDNKVYKYNTDNNQTFASFENINQKLYFTLSSSLIEPYRIIKITNINVTNNKYLVEDVVHMDVATGVIADFSKIQAKHVVIEKNCEAEYFVGDGSQLTGLPAGYDQDLNTTNSPSFITVSANSFVGDGSQLTGLPATADQTLNTFDQVEFDVVTANSYVGLPEGIKVFKILAGEGTTSPTAITDRTYDLPENGLGWEVGTAATMNASNVYGVELGTSSSDLIIKHPKGKVPLILKVQRNKNKGFPPGMGVTDYDIAWKANIANTAIRIDLFPEEEYEFWIQIVFV